MARRRGAMSGCLALGSGAIVIGCRGVDPKDGGEVASSKKGRPTMRKKSESTIGDAQIDEALLLFILQKPTEKGLQQWPGSQSYYVIPQNPITVTSVTHFSTNTNLNLTLHRDASIGGKGRTDYEVKGTHKKVPHELIHELKAICQENMTMDYDERYFHGKPQNSFHKAVNIPDVVVFPRSQEEVSTIVQCCNKHKVPIVPYGGATSIEGHTLSPDGGVCIDMTLMKHVKALHVEDMDVVVEPGIGWMELNEYLEPHGLFFPLDPGGLSRLRPGGGPT
ncbi:hypothetical protein RJ640_002667 [Escallonia rubra]|uniref:FAD-binding PCMH-type domain-containing protein n=1 Tax=Escallonia rubra TaxID=112253 RepID=A0AA88QTJ3_9ASTE|nr:hypothetical protein RJ640_002667 [Escallonia rubra]